MEPILTNQDGPSRPRPDSSNRNRHCVGGNPEVNCCNQVIALKFPIPIEGRTLGGNSKPDVNVFQLLSYRAGNLSAWSRVGSHDGVDVGPLLRARRHHDKAC